MVPDDLPAHLARLDGSQSLTGDPSAPFRLLREIRTRFRPGGLAYDFDHCGIDKYASFW
jgi:hypothetical protein